MIPKKKKCFGIPEWKGRLVIHMLTIRPKKGKLCVLNEVMVISIHNINVVVINDKFAVLFPMVGTVVASNVSRRAPIREASIKQNYYYKKQRNIIKDIL